MIKVLLVWLGLALPTAISVRAPMDCRPATTAEIRPVLRPECTITQLDGRDWVLCAGKTGSVIGALPVARLQICGPTDLRR